MSALCRELGGSASAVDERSHSPPAHAADTSVGKDWPTARPRSVRFTHGETEELGTTGQVVCRLQELPHGAAKPLTFVVHGGKSDLRLLERVFEIPSDHLRCPAPDSPLVDELLMAEPIAVDTQHLFNMYTRATRLVSLKKCCDVMKVHFPAPDAHNAANVRNNVPRPV